MENFDKQVPLVQGVFGNCFKAKRKSDDVIGCLKECHPIEDPEQKAACEKDFLLWSSIDHPNVVKAYESFWDNDKFCIFMEYVPNGSLANLIKSRLTEIEILSLFYKIFLGLSSIHEKGHPVYNLKPENVLLNEENEPKISDCCFSNFFLSSFPKFITDDNMYYTVVYSAPEFFENQQKGCHSDVWSLGMIFFQFLNGELPFSYNPVSILDIDVLSLNPTELVFSKYDSFKDLIVKMLDNSFESRITVKRLLLEPIFKRLLPSFSQNSSSNSVYDISSFRESLDNYQNWIFTSDSEVSNDPETFFVTLDSSVTKLAQTVEKRNTKLKTIVIHDLIKVLDEYCFRSFSSLTSIDLPQTITELKWGCFFACTSLLSIILPSSLTKIDGFVFFSCTSLESITIPSSVTSLGEHCFRSCSSLKSVVLPRSVTQLPRGCFYCCSSMTSITIADSIKQIGDSCFYFCKSLETITIPSSVSELGKGCFEQCTQLKTVNLPNSIQNLLSLTFKKCSALASIQLPQSIKSIGESCFESCTALSTFEVPSSVSVVSSKCFKQCSSLKSIKLCDSITELPEEMFFLCCLLESITIPANLKQIGNSCFYSCSFLQSISIPASVTKIGHYCFEKCSVLSAVDLFATITEIPQGCFRGCSALESIILPSSTKIIGPECFKSCSKLRKIVIPKSAMRIGHWCFSGCQMLFGKDSDINETQVEIEQGSKITLDQLRKSSLS